MQVKYKRGFCQQNCKLKFKYEVGFVTEILFNIQNTAQRKNEDMIDNRGLCKAVYS